MSNFDRDMTTARRVLVEAGMGENVAKHLAYRLAVELKEDAKKGRLHLERIGDKYGWITIVGFVDPPQPPEGHALHVKESPHMGILTHYRFVPIVEKPETPNPDSPWAKNWDVV